MLFNSAQFLLFFPAVVFIAYLVPWRLRNPWLLLASYIFYAAWDPRYVALILFCSIVGYCGGLALGAIPAEKRGRRRLVLAACAIAVLLVLFVFKYLDFTLGLAERLFEAAGVGGISVPRVNLALPVGISFFTFQSVGYLADVYRDDAPPERNFIDYALFVSFFPQLVAGPIERSGRLLPQLEDPEPFDFERARDGVLLMIWGYFLKLVIADRAAIFIDAAYGAPADFPGFYLVVASVLFAFQIYCDFAGYSTIAKGAAQVLGIELMDNFDAPYLASSVGDFWRRWHISLTSWFRDYVYIPLGGSRRGELRTHLNVLVVFLLSGLWHGASLSFVVWGGLNGLFQVAGSVTKGLRERACEALGIARDALPRRILSALITFVLIDIAWVFFRAEGIRSALSILASMASADNAGIFADGSVFSLGVNAYEFAALGIALLVLLIADIAKVRGICIRERIASLPYIVRIFVMSASIVLILVFGVWGPQYGAASFIYFQF